MTAQDSQAHLNFMVQEAREGLSFLSGISKFEFLNNRMLQKAIINTLANIGESAYYLLENDRNIISRYPKVPWEKISNMRHRLIHVYFKINMDLVWSVAEKDLPLLIQEISPFYFDPSFGKPE